MRTIRLICACAGVLALLLLLRTWHWWQQEGAAAGGFVITVGEGASLAAVSRQLAAEGALAHPRLWRALARLGGRDGNIKPGEYDLDRGMSPGQLLSLLVAGAVRQYQVTLPEGIRLVDAIGILQAQPTLVAVLDGPDDPRLLALVRDVGGAAADTNAAADTSGAASGARASRPRAEAGADAGANAAGAAAADTIGAADLFAGAASAEGLFFPDTYNYRRGDTDLLVLTLAHRRMRNLLGARWPLRAVGLPYTKPLDALVMASIVEREAGLAAERAQVAGVFVRRLRQGMRLQADPTVIYGLGEGFDGNLRRGHLRDRANPYNTYRHRGLPPTPIALPGLGAIEAALHPAAGNALYFVARGDGSHEFSETVQQHEAAVRRYQVNRKPDYRSAPAPSPNHKGEQ